MDNHITIKFVDFWTSFDCQDNPLVNALRVKYQVDVLPADSPLTPDILFYSRCGNGEHYRYDCLKIYYSGENDFPNFNECDYAISFYDCDCGGRNLRYPLYMFYQPQKAISQPAIADETALNRGFCSLVMSNSFNCDPDRLRIIDAVESYKPIAYGGAYRNNVGGRVADKLQFISGYKFNLALENSNMPGYVTEKILEPFSASTVPIYWGNEQVSKDFNPESFINVNDYDNFDSFLSALRKIDRSPELYLKMLRSPNGVKESEAKFDAALIEFLDKIVKSRRRYISRYGEISVLHERGKLEAALRRRPFVYKVVKHLFPYSSKR